MLAGARIVQHRRAVEMPGAQDVESGLAQRGDEAGFDRRCRGRGQAGEAEIADQAAGHGVSMAGLHRVEGSEAGCRRLRPGPVRKSRQHACIEIPVEAVGTRDDGIHPSPRCRWRRAERVAGQQRLVRRGEARHRQVVQQIQAEMRRRFLPDQPVEGEAVEHGTQQRGVARFPKPGCLLHRRGMAEHRTRRREAGDHGALVVRAGDVAEHQAGVTSGLDQSGAQRRGVDAVARGCVPGRA